MPRNRSRSRSKSPPARRKDRVENRERDNRERNRKRNRSRDRHPQGGSSRRYSRSPIDRKRDSSRDKLQGSSKSNKNALNERPVVTAADLVGKTEDEQHMMKMMGFCNFDTTKGKKVEGNEVGDVHVILKRKYRQYMNRKGGFNRPLDFVA